MNRREIIAHTDSDGSSNITPITLTVEGSHLKFRTAFTEQWRTVKHAVPLSALVGAAYAEATGKGVWFDELARVELLVLQPERNLGGRRRAVWLFRDLTNARSFRDELNELAVTDGVRADVALCSINGYTIVLGDRVLVSVAKSTNPDKMSRTIEYSLSDVTSVETGRYHVNRASRISVRLRDGSIVRTYFEAPDLQEAERFIVLLRSNPDKSAMSGLGAEVERLAHLYQSGALTADEFTAAKKRILEM